jgi:hypothetical protein
VVSLGANSVVDTSSAAAIAFEQAAAGLKPPGPYRMIIGSAFAGDSVAPSAVTMLIVTFEGEASWIWCVV